MYRNIQRERERETGTKQHLNVNRHQSWSWMYQSAKTFLGKQQCNVDQNFARFIPNAVCFCGAGVYAYILLAPFGLHPCYSFLVIFIGNVRCLVWLYGRCVGACVICMIVILAKCSCLSVFMQILCESNWVSCLYSRMLQRQFEHFL